MDRLPDVALSSDGCTAAGRTVTCGPEVALPVGNTAAFTLTVRLDSPYLGDGSDLGNIAKSTSAVSLGIGAAFALTVVLLRRRQLRLRRGAQGRGRAARG